VLHCADDDDVELESDILTDKLGTALVNDYERLKLCSVSNDFLSHLQPMLCFAVE